MGNLSNSVSTGNNRTIGTTRTVDTSVGSIVRNLTGSVRATLPASFGISNGIRNAIDNNVTSSTGIDNLRLILGVAGFGGCAGRSVRRLAGRVVIATKRFTGQGKIIFT